MSLDSYRKIIEAQHKRERLYSNESSGIPSGEQVEYTECYAPKSKRFRAGKLTLGIIIIALLFLAVLKNPSKTDAKAEIKTMIMEKITERMRHEVTNEDNDA